MSLIVQKYGGTSVASPAHIKNVAEHIVREKEKGNQLVVVVSAMGKATDDLTELAAQICDQPPKREMDMLLSVGERTTISLLAMALHDLGHEAISFTGSQVGIITDTKHTNARILEVRATRLLQELEKGKIVIVAGFQGVSISKEITTLGRGGSDTTAIALAAALKADRCELMKDVSGVYTADPRVIPNVNINSEISYNEMIEIANLGSGVVNSESLEIAGKNQIKIGVGSSQTGKVGSIITNRSFEVSHISGIVGRKKLQEYRVKLNSGTAISKLLFFLSELRQKVYCYSLIGSEVSLLIDKENEHKFSDYLKEQKITFEIFNNRGIVAIVGSGLFFNSELSSDLFQHISTLPKDHRLGEISPHKLSLLVDEGDVDDIIKLLYDTAQTNDWIFSISK